MRDWNNDSRIMNATDARQMVAAYRDAYSPSRFRRLLVLCLTHGHSAEVNAVVSAALESSDV